METAVGFPETIVMDTREEFALLTQAFNNTGAHLVSDWSVPKHIEQLFSSLHYVGNIEDQLDDLVSDCLEVFGYMGRDAREGKRYAQALAVVIESLYRKLLHLGLYTAEGYMNFYFAGFVGQDIVLNFLDEYY